MKDYPVRLTIGQVVFITLSLLIAGFLDFYLGARFGPELFWNIKVDKLAQESLLPQEVPEAELRELLKQTGQASISFHQELDKKTVSMGPLTEGPTVFKAQMAEPKADLVKQKSKTESLSITQKTETMASATNNNQTKIEEPLKKETTSNLKTKGDSKPVVVNKKEEVSKKTDIKKKVDVAKKNETPPKSPVTKTSSPQKESPNPITQQIEQELVW